MTTIKDAIRRNEMRFTLTHVVDACLGLALGEVRFTVTRTLRTRASATRDRGGLQAGRDETIKGEGWIDHS